MKKLLLLLLLLPSLAFAEVGKMNGVAITDASTILGVAGLGKAVGVTVAASAGECDGYLVCQNFETATTGYDNSETWVETADGTVEAAYTTTALRGSQSLYINDSAGTNETYNQFGTTNPVYAFFRYRPTSTANNAQIMAFNTTGAALSGYLRLDSDNYLNCFHGTVSAEGPSTLDDATTYFIWVQYQANTGAGDGILHVTVGTSATKSEGTVHCNITTGDDTDQAGRIKLHNNNADAGIYDQCLVDNAVIGDVPN